MKNYASICHQYTILRIYTQPTSLSLTLVVNIILGAGLILENITEGAAGRNRGAVLEFFFLI